MKKLSLSFAILFIICACFTPSVFALSVTPAYNGANGDLTLSGTAEGIVSIRVTPYEMSDDLLSKDNLPLIYHQIEANGNYNVTLRMPSNHRIGKYVVYVTDSKDSERKNIICYNKDEADALVDSASSLDDKEFIDTMTKEENIKKLGIDTTDPDYSANIVSIMADLYDDYIDSDDFISKYNYCKALNSLLGKNKEGVEERLLTYESVLSIEYVGDYTNNPLLTEDIKQNLCLLLSEMDYASNISYAEKLTGKTDFEAYFPAVCALAGAITQENWKGLEQLYTSDYKFLKTEIVNKNSDYKLCEPSEVFGELIKYDFEELSDLGSNFDKAVKVAKPGKKPSQGSGGGSGGGGSVSVGADLGNTPAYETLPNENIGSAKISYSLPELSEGNTGFSDVAETDWYKLAVSSLASSGIINGYEDGSFKPLSNITRAEFTKLVTSAFSLTCSDAVSFEDVSSDAWYAECINNASGAGVILGYDGYFNPEKFITRQDAVVIMGRIAKLFDIEYTGYKAFDDMADVSLYAITTVGSFYSSGILSGDGQGTFAPRDNITRAEASQLLYKLISDMNTRS